MPETEKSIIKDLKPGDVIGGPIDIIKSPYVEKGTYKMVVTDDPNAAVGVFGGNIPFILVPADKPNKLKTL